MSNSKGADLTPRSRFGSPFGSGRTAAWIVLAIGAAFSVAAWFFAESVVEREARFRFQSVATDIASSAQTHVRSYSDLLFGLQGLFDAAPVLDRTAFERYVYSLNLPLRYPGVRSVSYIRRVPAAAKAAFEKRMRRDPELVRRGYGNVVIHPAGERSEYFVLTYIEPLRANRAALGFDLGSDKARMSLIRQARDTGMPTLSERMVLITDSTQSETGVALRLALYRKDAFTPDVARRREAFVGLVNVVFQLNELAQRMLSGAGYDKFTLSIHDTGYIAGELNPAPQELYSNAALRQPRAGAVLEDTRHIDVGQRRWELKFSAPRDNFLRPADHVLPPAALAAVLVASLLLSGLIGSLAGSRRRAKTLAAQITADLRESQIKLTEQQRRTQELIEVLPNPIYFKGTDGRYLGVNKAWERFFGMPRGAFVGKTVHDLYPNDPDLAQRLHADDQALWDHPGTNSYETIITTSDGKSHNALFYKATFTGADGGVAGLIGTIVDITERKGVEQALRAANTQMQMLFQSSPLAIYTRDANGLLTSWNPAAEKMYGWTADEVLGKPLPSVSVEARPESDGYRRRLLAGETFIKQEARRHRRDGSAMVIDAFLSPLRDASGDITGIITVAADITERKEFEQRYRDTFDLAPVGIARTSLDGRYLQVNLKFLEMLGCSEQEVLAISPQEFMHPDDRARLEQDRSDILHGGVNHVTGERRFVRRDGRVIWTNRTISLARDTAGQPLYYISVIEDITKSKEREGRYRAMFENAAVGITRVDLNAVLVDVNQKFCDMLGYTRDELIGKPMKDITHPDDYGRGAGLRAEITKGATKEAIGEKRFLRKNGAIIWARRTMSIARDSAGNPQYVISVAEDITERKQAELRQEMEHTVTRLLSEADRSGGILPKIMQVIGESLGCAWGGYWNEDKQEKVMVCAETWGVPSAEIMEFTASNLNFRHPIHLSGGLFMRVWDSGEPVSVDDLTLEGGFRRAPLAAKAGLHSAFAFPVRSGNEILGVMEFFRRAGQPPDQALMLSTRSIGSQIGLFIARKQAEERIRHLAHYDELTGLANRNMFNQCLNHALAQARRNGKPLAILFIDLDRFKNINDTLGHAAGDKALCEVAERLRNCLRAGDTIGRLGGDEFVVLIEEMPQPAHSISVAQKILNNICKPLIVEGQELHITASIGISIYPADSEDSQGLLKNADIAMYRAKELGKNNFQFYAVQMNVHTVERLELESDLRRALERDEFVLHYQPKTHLASGCITGMEALVRWQHPDKGMIPPMQFIPLAEETGLIVPIGEWVLRTACAQNKSWRDQGLPPLCVSVNLSARQFVHEHLLQVVAKVLKETGLDPAGLELEITESTVMPDPERATRLLNQLKSMGVGISIDDFGTGYSSLSYLKRFPINCVKIDRSFVKDLPDDGDDASITQAIIVMAHGLGLSVIAEGAETSAQVDFLRAHGCDDVQGYYFGKPMPGHEFADLVLKQAESGKAAKKTGAKKPEAGPNDA